MNRTISQFLLIFFFWNATANNGIIIQGSFKNILDNSTVMLCQYNYENSIIAQASVQSSQCTLANLPALQDGVYQLVVNRPILENNQNNYFFNLIIEKSESIIEFFFDPENNYVPTFTNSNSNRNWSEFLKLQNFRIAVVNEIKLTNDSNYKGGNFPKFSKDILKNEIQELKNIKTNFIIKNFNKWSTYMVQYDLTYLRFDEKDKSTFWSKFDTSNTDLINTPIYQELIRYYLMTFCGTCDEEQYKSIFQEIIDVFSNNDNTKDWVLRYVVSGLQKIDNKSIIDFLAVKYNFRI